MIVVQTYLNNTFTYAVIPISRERLPMQVFFLFMQYKTMFCLMTIPEEMVGLSLQMSLIVKFSSFVWSE